MAYLGDIRENSIGPNGQLWEGDNRVEEHYYYNGMYIDLCGLPVEDYCKTIFVTDGSNTSGGDTPTIKVKNITLEIVNGDIVISYPGSVKTDLYVGVMYNDGKEQTIKIPVDTLGGSGINFGIEEEVTSVSEFGIGLTEGDALNDKKTLQDEEFKYQIVYNAPIVYPVAYQLTLMKGHIENMTEDEIISHLEKVEKLPMEDDKKSEVFTAKVEPIPVEGAKNMTVEELNRIFLESAQDLIIVTDKEIKDIVSSQTKDSVFEGWNKREEDLTIDNVVYHIWIKRAVSTELSSIYDPLDIEWKTGEIDKNSITFIIQYK